MSFIGLIICGTFHITEYYSAIKKNELLMHTVTWMDPKSIMLSDQKRSLILEIKV